MIATGAETGDGDSENAERSETLHEIAAVAVGQRDIGDEKIAAACRRQRVGNCAGFVNFESLTAQGLGKNAQGIEMILHQ